MEGFECEREEDKAYFKLPCLQPARDWSWRSSAGWMPYREQSAHKYEALLHLTFCKKKDQSGGQSRSFSDSTWCIFPRKGLQVVCLPVFRRTGKGVRSSSWLCLFWLVSLGKFISTLKDLISLTLIGDWLPLWKVLQSGIYISFL